MTDTYWPMDSAAHPRFAGPVSFFRLPMLDDPEGLDIPLVGLPWDGGTTNRPGTRHGPREIRAASTLIRPFHHVTRRSPYSQARVADLGDAPVNPIDIADSLAKVQAFYTRIAATGGRPVTAGGDHLITLPILRALARGGPSRGGPVGLVQFDAHADVNDSYFGGHRFTHGTWVRRAIEEGLVDPHRCVQIGIRGARYSADGGAWSDRAGIRTIYIEEVFERGPKAVSEIARQVVGEDPAYLTFDVDGLDPAFCPGTGTPEVGGYTSHDAQVMLRGLSGLNLIGADVVEVSPPFDASGTSALVGATMLFEILCLVADGRLAHP